MVFKQIEVKSGSQPNPKVKRDDELFADLDRARKRFSCFTCGGCLGFAILLLILVIGGVLGLVAATGVVRIPVVSDLVYPEAPRPSRVVEPGGSVTELDQFLASKVAGAELTDGATRLSLREEELTQLLRTPNAAGEVTFKQGQVAVDPEGIELYGQVTPPQLSSPVVVTANLIPAPNSGVLTLSSLKVGRVMVPPALAERVTSLILSQNFTGGIELGLFGIEAIHLGDQVVLLDLSPEATGQLLETGE